MKNYIAPFTHFALVALFCVAVFFAYKYYAKQVSPTPDHQAQFQTIEIPVTIAVPGYAVQFSADSTKPPVNILIRFVQAIDTVEAQKAGWMVGSIADKERNIYAVSRQQ